jgi:hypothetical protein
VTETEAVWLSAPEVAVKTTVDVVAVADADAERLTGCGVPGVRLKVEGEADTPEESPLAVTLIVPANPLRAVAESFTGCALPPAVRDKLDTFAAMEKSGAAVVEVTLPQPTLNPTQRRIASQQVALLFALDIGSALLSRAFASIPRVAPFAFLAICPRSWESRLGLATATLSCAIAL